MDDEQERLRRAPHSQLSQDAWNRWARGELDETMQAWRHAMLTRGAARLRASQRAAELAWTPRRFGWLFALCVFGAAAANGAGVWITDSWYTDVVHLFTGGVFGYILGATGPRRRR